MQMNPYDYRGKAGVVMSCSGVWLYVGVLDGKG